MSTFPVVSEINGIQRCLVVMCAGCIFCQQHFWKLRRWIKHKDDEAAFPFLFQRFAYSPAGGSRLTIQSSHLQTVAFFQFHILIYSYFYLLFSIKKMRTRPMRTVQTWYMRGKYFWQQQRKRKKIVPGNWENVSPWSLHGSLHSFLHPGTATFPGSLR